MEILVLHDKFELWEMARFNLEGKFHGKVHWVTNYVQAVDHLLEDNAVQLILCQEGIDGTKLLKYLLSVEGKIPYILVLGQGKAASGSQAFPDLVKLGEVTSFKELGEIVDLIERSIESGAIEDRQSDDSFCRIKTELLLKVIPLEADVYIRLSQIKYVKMFRKGRVFGQEDLDKYQGRKKIDYFYLKMEEVAGFIGQFQEKITAMVLTEKGSRFERAITAAAITEVVSELHSQLGFSPEVQKIAKAAVDMTVQSVGKDPQLKEIYSMIRDQAGSYFSFHSIATAHVACALAAKLEWPSESTFYKLSLAAFFHDIHLRGGMLSEIDTLEELQQKSATLSNEDVETFKGHPLAAATMIRNMKEVPPDVDLIVSQHHERPDGTGFPKGLTGHHIAPLAALFIVAHDLVKFTTFAEPEKAGFNQFVRQFRYTKDHTVGTFRKALMAVEFPVDGK